MSVSVESSTCRLWTNRRVHIEAFPVRALIVDDNEAGCEALAAALSYDAFQTRSAFSGLHALQVIDAWRPDVIVLDINMPEHDGFQTARVFRRLWATRHVAIVAFTALFEDDVRQRGMAAGFDGYCQKGTAPRILSQLLNQFAK